MYVYLEEKLYPCIYDHENIRKLEYDNSNKIYSNTNLAHMEYFPSTMKLTIIIMFS